MYSIIFTVSVCPCLPVLSVCPQSSSSRCLSCPQFSSSQRLFSVFHPSVFVLQSSSSPCLSSVFLPSVSFLNLRPLGVCSHSSSSQCLSSVFLLISIPNIPRRRVCLNPFPYCAVSIHIIISPRACLYFLISGLQCLTFVIK